MKNAFVRFIKEEDGLEMLEWALVAALFVAVGAAAWGTLGSSVSAEISKRATALDTATAAN